MGINHCQDINSVIISLHLQESIQFDGMNFSGIVIKTCGTGIRQVFDKFACLDSQFLRDAFILIL